MMPVYSNKKIISVCIALFATQGMSAEATQLHLDGNDTLEIIGTAAVNLLSDHQLQHLPYSNSTTVYLTGNKKTAEIELYNPEPLTLFWNGNKMPHNSEREWVFINGACKEAKTVRIIDNDGNNRIARSTAHCETPPTSGGAILTGAILTIVSIKPQTTAGLTEQPFNHPNVHSRIVDTFQHDSHSSIMSGLAGFFAGSESAGGKGYLSGFSSYLSTSGMTKELTFLDNMFQGANNDVVVYVASTPIKVTHRQGFPYADDLQQLVENARNIEELFDLISTAFPITSDIQGQFNLNRFIEEVTEQDGITVSIVKLSTYLKKNIKNSKGRPLLKDDINNEIGTFISNASKKLPPSIPRLTDDSEASDHQNQQERVEGATALDYRTDPGIEGLVGRFVAMMDSNVNRVIKNIFPKHLPMNKKFNSYGKIKNKIRNSKGGVDPKALLDMWRTIVKNDEEITDHIKKEFEKKDTERAERQKDKDNQHQKSKKPPPPNK